MFPLSFTQLDIFVCRCITRYIIFYQIHVPHVSSQLNTWQMIVIFNWWIVFKWTWCFLIIHRYQQILMASFIELPNLLSSPAWSMSLKTTSPERFMTLLILKATSIWQLGNCNIKTYPLKWGGISMPLFVSGMTGGKILMTYFILLLLLLLLY